MESSLFSWLLLSCCLFAFPAINIANQIDHLDRLMELRRSSNPPRVDSWDPLDSDKAFSPIYMSPQDGLMEADKIVKLPGQPEGVNFDQYAGHVTVDPQAGRALFYYFVESPEDPSTKPLVLWLNGGPGCSSFGIGAMEELGPFRVNSDGKTLFRNDYAWNEVSNVIFLESPASVGFSYSTNSSDYELNGDKRTAEDSYTFLVNWLERFPQYKGRDFFITGESYAGHYVPQLAYTILQNNNGNQTGINLKGIAIGNAWIDDATSTEGMYDYFWTHALNSDEVNDEIASKCDFSNANFSSECLTAQYAGNREVGGIDIYNIYAPLCHDANQTTNSTGSVAYFDPCSDNYVAFYLNLPEVQWALHANITASPYPWGACSGRYNWSDSPTTILPIIKELMASSISVWIYSGDTDGRVPVTSSRYSINTLGLPILNSWRPWYTNEEVGGYVVQYEGLVFATVRGAGHLVPSYQPERALTIISAFLQGKLPPSQ